MKPFAKVVSFTAAGAMAIAALPAAAAAHAPKAPPASQLVVTLRSNHPVYQSPGGSRRGSVSKNRPITGWKTSLPVLRDVKHSGATWLKVLLPGRPNSHSGWIHAGRTEAAKARVSGGDNAGLWRDSWHIIVSTGQRRAFIYNHGHLVRNWLVVVGRQSAPTPHGHFFVEENVNEGRGSIGGPFALATSARSAVFKEFDGGPGQVALHGMDGGLYATPGSAVSHGCVRLLDKDITWLAHKIYPGTPVTIIG